MAFPAAVSLKDLESKGFVHVPGFLTPAELQVCCEDYLAVPVDSNRNYALSNASSRVIDVLRSSIKDVINRVNAATDIRADLLLAAQYFATKRGIKFFWHQDHESYFITQNHYDYLNLYIAVVKPRPEKSNLSIVPFDVLKQQNPETYRRVFRSGAATIRTIGTRDVVVHDDTGSLHAVSTTFDRLAVTPELNAGDLLLMRGDILHKTQDEDTARVALSIRLASSKTIVRRSRLADGGKAKSAMMSRNIETYQRVFEAFEAAGRDEMPLIDLIRHQNELRKTGKTPAIHSHPGRYILAQKVRSGVVLSSARKALNEVVVNPVLRSYYGLRARPAPSAARPQTA